MADLLLRGRMRFSFGSVPRLIPAPPPPKKGVACQLVATWSYNLLTIGEGLAEHAPEEEFVCGHRVRVPSKILSTCRDRRPSGCQLYRVTYSTSHLRLHGGLRVYHRCIQGTIKPAHTDWGQPLGGASVMDINWLGLHDTSLEVDHLSLGLPSFSVFHRKRHQCQNILPEGLVLKRKSRRGTGPSREFRSRKRKTRGGWFGGDTSESDATEGQDTGGTALAQ